MKWVYVEDLASAKGQDVEIRGWVYNTRSSGRIRFILVRDGTGLVQATIFSKDDNDPLFEKFDSLTQESSLIVRGRVREDKRAPGGYELGVSEIEIVQVARDYPITLKEHSTPFLMDTTPCPIKGSILGRRPKHRDLRMKLGGRFPSITSTSRSYGHRRGFLAGW